MGTSDIVEVREYFEEGRDVNIEPLFRGASKKKPCIKTWRVCMKKKKALNKTNLSAGKCGMNESERVHDPGKEANRLHPLHHEY